METISALFLDYDNVSKELERDSPQIAATFSNRPLFWLRALHFLDHTEDDGTSIYNRRIVSRRCYATPYLIGKYRRNFTHSGFEVIDCPPLTSQGKNSADIQMVMDILDHVSTHPHIEEYIILSGDADFVPVLNRLRRELKTSVIFAATNIASAYRNCSDATIGVDFFRDTFDSDAQRTSSAMHLVRSPITREVVDKPIPAKLSESPANLVDEQFAKQAESLIEQAANRRLGAVHFATVAQVLRDHMAEELGEDWYGKRSFSRLISAIRFEQLDVNFETQMFELPGFLIDLNGWDDDTEEMRAFVTKVGRAASRHFLIQPPAVYEKIFQLFAEYYNDEPEGFSDAIAHVANSLQEMGFEIDTQEIRFIGNGISMQGYRFDRGAEPEMLARLWRLNLFDICGEPAWLETRDQAKMLVHWMHAANEDEDDALNNFLEDVSAQGEPEDPE